MLGSRKGKAHERNSASIFGRGTSRLKTHVHSDSVDDGSVFEERHRYGRAEFCSEPVICAGGVGPVMATIALEILVQGNPAEECRPVGKWGFNAGPEGVDAVVVIVGDAVDFGRLPGAADRHVGESLEGIEIMIRSETGGRTMVFHAIVVKRLGRAADPKIEEGRQGKVHSHGAADAIGDIAIANAFAEKRQPGIALAKQTGVGLGAGGRVHDDNAAQKGRGDESRRCFHGMR